MGVYALRGSCPLLCQAFSFRHFTSHAHLTLPYNIQQNMNNKLQQAEQNKHMTQSYTWFSRDLVRKSLVSKKFNFMKLKGGCNMSLRWMVGWKGCWSLCDRADHDHRRRWKGLLSQRFGLNKLTKTRLVELHPSLYCQRQRWGVNKVAGPEEFAPSHWEWL